MHRHHVLIQGVMLVLLASFFSMMALGEARRWHPDEAFYMTSARHAAVDGDWWLLAEPLDKPPLTFYINALALVMFAIEADVNGVLQLDVYKGEFAGRIPATLMSVLLVAVCYALIYRLSRDRLSALVGAYLVAVSPLRIAFSATAFTDMPMLLTGSLALWMASRGRWFASALWLMLSISAKPQVIFYLPLLLSVLWLYSEQNLKRLPAYLLRFALPLVIGLSILWAWDSLRVIQGAESFYQLGQARYTPTMLTLLQDYPLRVITWWQTVQYSFGQGILTLILLGWAIWRLPQVKRAHQVGVLWAWVLAFIGAHIILTLNLFDRNQLIILPVLALIASWHLPRNKGAIVILSLLLALMSFGAWQGAQGRLPIGGDDGRHDGIDQLALYLNQKPIATVIYDRWLDWELDYYMGQWTDKRRVYYPTPDELVNGALALDERGMRYFIAPQSVDLNDWLQALTNAGFAPTLDRQFEQFIVYRLHPPS